MLYEQCLGRKCAGPDIVTMWMHSEGKERKCIVEIEGSGQLIRKVFESSNSKIMYEEICNARQFYDSIA